MAKKNHDVEESFMSWENALDVFWYIDVFLYKRFVKNIYDPN